MKTSIFLTLVLILGVNCFSAFAMSTSEKERIIDDFLLNLAKFQTTRYLFDENDKLSMSLTDSYHITSRVYNLCDINIERKTRLRSFQEFTMIPVITTLVDVSLGDLEVSNFYIQSSYYGTRSMADIAAFDMYNANGSSIQVLQIFSSRNGEVKTQNQTLKSLIFYDSYDDPAAAEILHKKFIAAINACK